MLTEAILHYVHSQDNDSFNLKSKYLRELRERKRLYNILQEIKGNIRVFCRCRPLNS